MSDALILRDDQDGIATLTLAAPGTLNALSTPMLQARPCIWTGSPPMTVSAW